WNPLAWERTDLVEFDVQSPMKSNGGVSVLDSHGKPLVAQVLSSQPQTNSYHLLARVDAVPALGYTVLHLVPGGRSEPSDLSAHGTTLENSELRVTVDPKSGCVTSLYDKKEKFESLAAGGCGNQLIAFADKPKAYDAWNIDADFEKVSTPLTEADSVEL